MTFAWVCVPDSPDFLTSYTAAPGDINMGPDLMDNTGQTEWADGLCQQSGFTTTFTPNTVVPYRLDGITYDVDFNSQQEGRSVTQPTYAAVTARSYHPGLVNAVFMDGSVRAISDSITVDVWRALGTRAGPRGEPPVGDQL